MVILCATVRHFFPEVVETWLTKKRNHFNIEMMRTIKNPYNNYFIKVFSDPANLETLLKLTLPPSIVEKIVFSRLKLEPGGFVDDALLDSCSDLVGKAVIKTGIKKETEKRLDIYFLFEHKAKAEVPVLVQILKYLYHAWQEDTDNKKPLRVIVPIVFYHGPRKWKVPRSFADQFDVSPELKSFLLDFKYILFDTREWDFDETDNSLLQENVRLLTALMLFKDAFNKHIDILRKLVELWAQKGLLEDISHILASLTFIVETKDVTEKDVIKILEESQIKGGEIMPTLAQRWVEQGRQLGRQEGRQLGRQEERVNTLKEIARNMLGSDFSIDEVMKATGLTEVEVKALLN